jgi:hypothetical protein
MHSSSPCTAPRFKSPNEYISAVFSILSNCAVPIATAENDFLDSHLDGSSDSGSAYCAATDTANCCARPKLWHWPCETSAKGYGKRRRFLGLESFDPRGRPPLLPCSSNRRPVASRTEAFMQNSSGNVIVSDRFVFASGNVTDVTVHQVRRFHISRTAFGLTPNFLDISLLLEVNVK